MVLVRAVAEVQPGDVHPGFDEGDDLLRGAGGAGPIHQHMAQIAELGRLAVALAIEPGIRVGHRLVGLIRALLAAEILPAVAARIGRRSAAILRLEALDRRPGLDQRPVNREMLARQQWLDPRVGQHRQQKTPRDVALQEPVAVLGEHRHIPHRGIQRQPDKPAEQHVVADLLHQLPFRADAIKRLQQQRPQQLLRRDRGPAVARIEHRKLSRQPLQRRVRNTPDHPQRMISRNQGFWAAIAEQRTCLLVPAAHPTSPTSRAQ